MRYWWVNQNQTYRQEVGGHYLWSPKRKTNGARNHFYETMREVAPGDIVLSFCDTRIAALGVVKSYCYESPKPTQFGRVGANWGAIGWKVETHFTELANQVRPKDFVKQLIPHFSSKYSPLRPTGDGLQSVYLTEVSAVFAGVIFQKIGTEVDAIAHIAETLRKIDPSSPALEPTLAEWEQHEENRIKRDAKLPDTSRLALIEARRGQGIFRTNVRSREKMCRVTRVERVDHLIASHIQPWRDSSNEERLDGENGLLLTPTIDHLFDKGFISFENDGALIISPVADSTSMLRMGIDPQKPPNAGRFSAGQRRFLDYHRENVLRMMHR